MPYVRRSSYRRTRPTTRYRRVIRRVATRPMRRQVRMSYRRRR